MTLAALRRAHRWLGLLLAVPLLIQGVSGAILALAPVLPNLTGIPVTKGEAASASAIVAAAATAVPHGLRPTRYLPAAALGELALVHFIADQSPRGPGLDVSVDPVSLGVLGMRTGGPIEWIKALHTNLLIEGRFGRSIIGWVGVALLALTMNGVVLWWPRPRRWRQAVTIDVHAAGHMFHRRVHGAIGVWSVALLLATAATGMVLAFPQTMRAALGLQDAGSRRPARQGEAPAIYLDQAIALARKEVPALGVRAVLLPTYDADPIRVLLAPPHTEGATSTVTVTVDATAPRVLSVQDPRTMPYADRALRWARDLHFGQALGPVWRGLTIATGLLLPVFAVTGGAMWLHRRHRRVPALQPGE